MSDNLTITFKGADFRKLAEQVQISVQREIDATAAEVVEEARRVVPKKSGASAASIYWTSPLNGFSASAAYSKANALYKPWARKEIERIIQLRLAKSKSRISPAIVAKWRQQLYSKIGWFKRVHAAYGAPRGTAIINSNGYFMRCMEFGASAEDPSIEGPRLNKAGVPYPPRTAQHIVGKIAERHASAFQRRIARLIK